MVELCTAASTVGYCLLGFFSSVFFVIFVLMFYDKNFCKIIFTPSKASKNKMPKYFLQISKVLIVF